jgi:hypothetical protein
MIIALITWLFKKYAIPALTRYRGNRALRTIRNTVTLLMLLVSLKPAAAQEQTVKYNVLHSGKVVGHLNLYQKRTGESLYLRMVSEVKMRFIFSIRVNCNEESTFENGRLMSSHVLRNVNGKEKANRQTTAVGDAYQTLAEGKGGKVDQKDISANLMLLYTREPADNAQVYSDNFQQFLKVKQSGSHVYRIDLPDGNYNYYTYTNGVCSKVDIHHSLYTIQIELA